MIDARSIATVALALGVPVALLLAKRERALLGWTIFVSCVDIFSPTVVVNMSASRVVGVLLLPSLLARLPRWLGNRVSGAMLTQWAYLAVLGVFFGFLFPWSDDGFYRVFTNTAPGRTVIQLLRIASDASVAVFVADQVSRHGRLRTVFRALLVGFVVAALAGIAERLSGRDLYNLVTALRELPESDRVRGLSFEPRGLGLIAAHGVLFALLLYHRSRKMLAAVFLAAVSGLALLLTQSTSAFFALGAGFVCLLFGLNRRARMTALRVAAVIGVATGLFAATETGRDRLRAVSEHSGGNLSVEKYDVEPRNRAEAFAFRLEVFDTGALLFLFQHPVFALSGVGPGLISIPATSVVPTGVRSNWFLSEGIGMIGTPTMGALLELSNGGVLGLGLWAAAVVAGVAATRVLQSRGDVGSRDWEMARGALTAAAGIYAVQTTPLSVIWPIFLGLGIGAADRLRRERETGAERERGKGPDVLASEVNSAQACRVATPIMKEP